jgi:hypothetical protein
MHRTATLLVLVLCLPLHACSAAQGTNDTVRDSARAKPAADGEGQGPTHESAADGPRVLLSGAGGKPLSVKVEVARNDQERQRGLMFRTHMDEDVGMLFIFDKSDQLTFWMHNTYIPLDMLFIEPSLRVLGIVENAAPRNDAPRSVPGNSQYVLELNGGYCQRHGVMAGSVARLQDVGPLPPGENVK